MAVGTLSTGLISPRWSIWGVTCLGLVEKWMFFHLSAFKWVLELHNRAMTIDLSGPWIYLLGNTINVCWNPQNRARFSETIDLRGHMPSFTLKMNVFPSISLRNPINVCWNPQNRAHFSEMIDLRGHMPRFSWKMNIFPPMSLETCINVLLKPSEQASFFWENWFEGSHA